MSEMERIAGAQVIAKAMGAGRDYRDDLVSEAVLAVLTGCDVKAAVRRQSRRELTWRKRMRSLEHIRETYRAEAPERAMPPQMSMLYEALKALPQRQYEVVVLKFFGELTEEEAAAKMGIDQRTVSAHFRRALGSLRIFFGAE